jgi:integrase
VSAPLARRPAATDALAAAAAAAGARLPAYVTREQAPGVIAAAASTRDRLLFECLWQTGGRVTEVLRLRRGARAGGVGHGAEERLPVRRRAGARLQVHPGHPAGTPRRVRVVRVEAEGAEDGREVGGDLRRPRVGRRDGGATGGRGTDGGRGLRYGEHD